MMRACVQVERCVCMWVWAHTGVSKSVRILHSILDSDTQAHTRYGLIKLLVIMYATSECACALLALLLFGLLVRVCIDVQHKVLLKRTLHLLFCHIIVDSVVTVIIEELYIVGKRAEVAVRAVRAEVATVAVIVIVTATTVISITVTKFVASLGCAGACVFRRKVYAQLKPFLS